jgi:signal transduction histidine kinase
VVGAANQYRRGFLRGWLLFAMVLLAGSQVHQILWPYDYDSLVLTDADALRLAFVVVIAVGGVTELWRIASERAALLAAEQEQTRRLKELASLKADFSAMVAHELGSPLSAMQRLADMLRVPDLGPEGREFVAAALSKEVGALDGLVADVQTAASVERDDFEVTPRPVVLEALLGDAWQFARALPGGHPVKTVLEDGIDPGDEVRADPERIAQVLRNLLGNAAKHMPEGTPIELRAAPADGAVRIEVSDRGPGIHPDDLRRIFEKFGRGRSSEGQRVAGVGLGLYLSRRIVQSHGAELEVRSTPGEGSVFSFELEAVERTKR